MHANQDERTGLHQDDGASPDAQRRWLLGLLPAVGGLAAAALFDPPEVRAFSATPDPACPSVFRIINVTDYGAMGNGCVDDTTAIQNALDAIPPHGALVFFPTGTYPISRTLEIADRMGFTLEGTGSVSSTLYWRGRNDAAAPMLRLTKCASSTLSRLRLIAVTKEAYCAIESTGNGASGELTFDKIIIDGEAAAVSHFTRGVRFTSLDGAADANNDRSTFRDCAIKGCTEAGVSIEHSQSKAHVFYNCQIRRCTIGVATHLQGKGVTAKPGGSFLWFGGYMSSNSVADFFLSPIANNNDPIVISGMGSEGSNRLLDGIHEQAEQRPVLLQGIRFATGPKAPLAADGHVIRLGHPGPLTIMGSIFDTDKPSTIFFDPRSDSHDAAKLVSIGNVFTARWPPEIPADEPADPYVMVDDPTFTSKGYLVSLGNTVRLGPGGIRNPLPDHWSDKLAKVEFLDVERVPTLRASGSGVLTGSSTTVLDPRLGPDTQIHVTLTSAPGPAALQWVENHANLEVPDSSYFIIHTRLNPAPGTEFRYFLVNPSAP